MIRRLVLLVLLVCLGLPTVAPAVETPRGYYPQLELLHQGQQLSFGPFVGYYFRPESGDDLTRLRFRCYNERQFYTDQLPADALLFEGEAILGSLPQVQALVRSDARIEPVFFTEAPPEWLEARPEPQDQFVHFHSAYSASGPSFTGYWLRHQPVRSFLYNMGGRIGADSPLYHQATPDEPQRFPHIIEFDAGSTGQ